MAFKPSRKMLAVGGAFCICLYIVYRPTLPKTLTPAIMTERETQGTSIIKTNIQTAEGPNNSSVELSIPVGPTGVKLTPDMKPYLQEEAFYMYLFLPRAHCMRVARMGLVEDGGWNMCIDYQVRPVAKKCLVYSFGINRDWSFDEAIEEVYNCDVHAFDPSIKKEDHKHSEKIWFHNLGLSGKDGVLKETWKVKTLKSIMDMLNHGDRVVDMVKMDIEGSEWDAIPDMIKTGALNNVKQFAFELHMFTHQRYPGQEIISQSYELLKSLDDAGFRLFSTHINTHRSCAYISPITKKLRYSCMELHYVNSKFYDQTQHALQMLKLLVANKTS